MAVPNTASAPAADPNGDYGVIASPLSDLGKSGKADEPTKLMAVAIDVPREPSTQGIEMGKWSTGLCNCFDFCVPNCLMATFCPCISVAQIATRLGFKYQTVLIAFGLAIGLEYLMYIIMSATVHSTTIESTYDSRYGYYSYSIASNSLSVWGYIGFVISIAIFIAFWQLRTKVRERFQLPGSCVEDFFVSWCCSCCSIAQMATHVKSYKPHSCDFGPPDELPAYGAQE